MDRMAVAAIAALQDDVRRALYEAVRDAGRPLTREDAAAAVGISRKLAAFHLDKLVDLGLLTSTFGAGPRRVGRAPRVYTPAAHEISVRLPHRTPEVLADILLAAVLSERSSEPAADAAFRIARERGAAVGAEERQHVRGSRLGAERALHVGAELLARQGYEPYRCPAGLRLRNCPFHPLAARAPEFVCGLNQAYLAGVVEGLGAGDRVDARLAPAAGECCVELTAGGPR
jgi:predicted ArsR family transcriptional regulator